MLLRSSSTPVLGSLLPSFSDNPNNNIHHESNTTCLKHPSLPTNIHQNHNKLSLYQTGSLNLSTFSCNSSPISPSIAELDRPKGFRRAQSEGNLEGLAYASCNSNNVDIYCDAKLPKKLSGKAKYIMLQTIPSSKGGWEDEEEESDIEEDYEREGLEDEELLERDVIGEEIKIMAMEGHTSSMENRMNNTILTKEVNVKDGIWNLGYGGEREMVGQEMYLAIGLGMGGGGGGGSGFGGGGGGGSGGEFNSAGAGGDGGDNHGVEEYFKRMVEENPGNALCLRNYAQFLYQSKRDLEGAEEYYSRAILADAKDGDILSQYAKIVWELHHDQDRALSYFERAVQASPEDSHVQAAYANFLWETEEYEDERKVEAMPPQYRKGAVASASA